MDEIKDDISPGRAVSKSPDPRGAAADEALLRLVADCVQVGERLASDPSWAKNGL